jgi:dATP pyrophosphohydrolase
MKSDSNNVSGTIVYVIRTTGNDRQVLFMRRSGGLHKGGWWPVAGTPKPDELPIDTALRELAEETGLRPTGLYEFGMEIPNVDGVRVLVAHVVYVNEDAAIELDHEHDDFRWVSADEAISMVPEGSRRFLEHLDRNFISGTPKAGLIELVNLAR